MNTSVLTQNVNSDKLVISAEHNFLVCGQVSLPTMPTDLNQRNSLCDFIVGISISTESPHAPMVHHHPTRNISLLHQHDKQTRTQGNDMNFAHISITFIEVVISRDVGEGRLGPGVPTQGIAVLCLDEGRWGCWRQLHLHHFILLRQEGIVQELA